MAATADPSKRPRPLRPCEEKMSAVGTGQVPTGKSEVIMLVPCADRNGGETLPLLLDGVAASAAAILVADQLAAWLLVRRRLGSAAAPGVSTGS